MNSEAFLRQNGYVVVPGAADAQLCADVIDEMRRADRHASRDDSGRTVRVDAAHTSLSVVALIQEARLSAEIGNVLGPSWSMVLNRHNHVTADYGEGSKSARLHRDVLHWTRTLLTMVVVLDCEADALSWATLVPGSHLLPRTAGPNGGGYWLDDEAYASISHQAVAVPLRPRDVLMMDPLLFHAAGYGRPDRPRIVYTAALRAMDELSRATSENELMIVGSQRYEGQRWWGADDH